MSKGIYLGSAEIAAKAKKMYLGVDGVARKIKKVYLGVDGVARLCYSGGPDVAGMSISYTGSMTDEVVTMSGVGYRLLTLLTSGTLSVPEAVNAEVWMCGGGTSGGVVTGGGAGAFASQLPLQPMSATTVAVIGAGGVNDALTDWSWVAGGATKFSTSETPTNFTNSTGDGICGGSGGGGSRGPGGSGDGIAKIPFGDETYFTQIPCAGGGGGAYRDTVDDEYWNGGNGGSNGNVGSAHQASSSSATQQTGGVGGNYGGGNGGDSGTVMSSGSAAVFYGSGGGAGGFRYTSKVTKKYGGNGYQGVIYVRIPLNQ